MVYGLLLLMMIDTNNYCAVCHSDIQAQYTNSIHKSEQIRCKDCHGGDASSEDMNKAHGGDYKGILEKKLSLELCASCHSDLKKMKPYGLPADQYALYMTSFHGIRFAEGDNNSAVCTDCHGSHTITKSNDPMNPVYKTNIARTCSNCHDNKTIMKNYTVSSGAGYEYLKSIHADELYKKGNRQAPTCTDCHGTHGAAPPGVADVAKVCGQCHRDARDYFLQSPHKKAMDSRQIPECVACHDNHKVMKATIEDLHTLCKKCHDKGTSQARSAEKIFTMFTATRDQLDSAQKAIKEAESIPINVEDYKSRIEEAYTYYTRAFSMTHSLKMELFQDLLDKSRKIAEEVQSEIHGKKSEINDRKLIFIALWFYIVITIVVIYQYKKSKTE